MKRIVLNDVSRAFGRRYGLYKVTHTFEAGSVTAILGGNGAGKTTLLQILATLSSPTSGTVHYDKLSHELMVKRGRQYIGWLGHGTSLFPELTGRENLDFFARMYCVEGRQDRVTAWLRRVNLEDDADRQVSTYSRGMLQRLALARTLIHAPRIVLLDEPFTGLDQSSKKDVAQILMKLREAGCIIIFITHDFDLDPELTDTVLLLERGEVRGVRRRKELGEVLSLAQTYGEVFGEKALGQDEA